VSLRAKDLASSGAWVDRDQGYDVAELYEDEFDETGEKRSKEE